MLSVSTSAPAHVDKLELPTTCFKDKYGLLPNSEYMVKVPNAHLLPKTYPVGDNGYTADSGSILIHRCRHLIAGLARSVRTVWHNETR